MKSMQRKFGGLMKRTEDQADVGTVLAEFKAADEMLERLLRDLKAWKDSWDDILRFQYDGSEAFASLYKPIEPTNDPEQRSQPAETPQKYMAKCLGLKKIYSELKDDLQQEMTMVDAKLLRPTEEARQQLKPLKKTVKHRENMKLDYERYQSRADHARKKEARSAKEEAALSKHESDLAQAQIGYQSADDQIKETFPPVTAAVRTLMPYLLASQIKLQTTLVGQLYTVLDEYTRKHGLPNPAPPENEIISSWEREFTSFRQELESGISTIANGKAVNMAMTLPPEKDGSTLTGLGLRNKVKSGGASVMSRKPSGQSATGQPATEQSSSSSFSNRPTIGWRKNTNSSQAVYEEQDDEELAPPKPPRPGGGSGMSIPAMPSPSIPVSSKPRIPSSASAQSPSQPPPPYSAPYSAAASTPPSYDTKPKIPTPNVPNPWANEQSQAGATPPSRYATPLANTTPSTLNAVNAAGADYFANAARRTSATSSASAAGIAAKKKPPPPVPVKRIASQQMQYVTALFDFEGQNEGDLAFQEGDRIRVVRKTESTDDWWEGELGGRVGSFPANYVRV